MLQKYTPDPTHVIEHEIVPLWEDLSYEDRPSWILAWDTRQLCNKVIPLVKDPQKRKEKERKLREKLERR